MLQPWNSNKPPLGARLNPSHPLAKGLVGCWLMNEGGGGKLFDLSGKNNTGTITNALWTSGKFGSCLSFDGNDDYAQITDNATLRFGTGDFAVSAWFNYAGVDSSGYSNIISKGRTGDAEWFMDVFTNFVRFYAGNTMVVGSSGATSVSTNTWYNVIATRNGSNGYIYLNGLLKATDTSSSVDLSTTKNIKIGVNTEVTDRDFNGKIDDVKIYNYALTPSQIKQLYTEPYCMFQKPLRRNINYTAITGKNMKINISDSWRDVADLKINVGDSWRSVVGVKKNVGDSWKTVF